jgi:hypothetical protein
MRDQTSQEPPDPSKTSTKDKQGACQVSPAFDKVLADDKATSVDKVPSAAKEATRNSKSKLPINSKVVHPKDSLGSLGKDDGTGSPKRKTIAKKMASQKSTILADRDKNGDSKEDISSEEDIGKSKPKRKRGNPAFLECSENDSDDVNGGPPKRKTPHTNLLWKRRIMDRFQLASFWHPTTKPKKKKILNGPLDKELERVRDTAIDNALYEPSRDAKSFTIEKFPSKYPLSFLAHEKLISPKCWPLDHYNSNQTDYHKAYLDAR